VCADVAKAVTEPARADLAPPWPFLTLAHAPQGPNADIQKGGSNLLRHEAIRIEIVREATAMKIEAGHDESSLCRSMHNEPIHALLGQKDQIVPNASLFLGRSRFWVMVHVVRAVDGIERELVLLRIIGKTAYVCTAASFPEAVDHHPILLNQILPRAVDCAA
jgi:hypothetical protein